MAVSADERAVRAGVVAGDVVASVDGHAVVALESFNVLTNKQKTCSFVLVNGKGESKRVQLSR